MCLLVHTFTEMWSGCRWLLIIPGDRPHFKLDGCYLTIQHGQPAFPPAEPRFPVLAFSIPDLDQAIEKLRNHGVDLPWGEETNENGRWVMFRDPAGNLVELVELKK
jgi:predicted enzyme related to lactoylglutathione lyase